jgi:hypothetical protein
MIQREPKSDGGYVKAWRQAKLRNLDMEKGWEYRDVSEGPLVQTLRSTHSLGLAGAWSALESQDLLKFGILFPESNFDEVCFTPPTDEQREPVTQAPEYEGPSLSSGYSW